MYACRCHWAKLISCLLLLIFLYFVKSFYSQYFYVMCLFTSHRRSEYQTKLAYPPTETKQQTVQIIENVNKICKHSAKFGARHYLLFQLLLFSHLNRRFDFALQLFRVVFLCSFAEQLQSERMIEPARTDSPTRSPIFVAYSSIMQFLTIHLYTYTYFTLIYMCVCV